MLRDPEALDQVRQPDSGHGTGSAASMGLKGSAASAAPGGCQKCMAQALSLTY